MSFLCPGEECRGLYEGIEDLQAHLCFVHCQYLPFECDVCQKRLPTEHRFAEHWAAAHGNSQPKLILHYDQAKNREFVLLAMKVMQNQQLPPPSTSSVSHQPDGAAAIQKIKAEFEDQLRTDTESLPLLQHSVSPYAVLEQLPPNTTPIEAAPSSATANFFNQLRLQEPSFALGHSWLSTLNQSPIACSPPTGPLPTPTNHAQYYKPATFTSTVNLKQRRKANRFKNVVQKQKTSTMKLITSCEQCGRQFNNKYNLKVHQAVHSEAKAFGCEFCGKCFTQSGSLYRHRREYHLGGKKSWIGRGSGNRAIPCKQAPE